MNVLGVGFPELVVIFIIMLVVAGPKRMIQWAYVLGQYTAQLREMWQQTVSALQKELADANIDLPKDMTNLIPKGRFDILGEATKIINATPESAKPAEPTQPAAQPDEENKRYDSWLPK